jgi:hypothetical protein
VAEKKAARNIQGIVLSVGGGILLACWIGLESVDASVEAKYAVLASLLLCFYILMDIFSQKRTKLIRELASHHQFSYIAHPQEEIPAQLRNMSFFRYRGTLRNMVQGERKGVTFLLVDREKLFYQWPTPDPGADCQTAVALYATSFALPAFELEPEGLVDKITCRLLKNDIDFATHPEFSTKYLLLGQEESRVRDLFNGHVLAFFETTEGWSVESEGGWVVLYKRDKQVDTHYILTFLDEALGIFKLLTDRTPSQPKEIISPS